MKNTITLVGFGIFLSLLLGCSGMKVIRPGEENKDKGTKMIDWSSGAPKIVSTYTCSIVAVTADNKKVTAVGKTEAEARKEALAKCKDQILLSFCREENVKCVQN